MKTDKRIQIGTVLAAIFLLSMASVTGVHALAADSNISGSVTTQDVTDKEKAKAIEIAKNDPKVKEMLPWDAQVIRVEIPPFAKKGDGIYNVVFKSGEFIHTITVNSVSGEVQGSVSTRGEMPKAEDDTLPVAREDVIVYFKEMPASLEGFASKHGGKLIFAKPDIKMAAFETNPKKDPGKTSKQTSDFIAKVSRDSLVEKTFEDGFKFMDTKKEYSTKPLILGPEYYGDGEYVPNKVVVGFWRLPPSLEEFASRYGGKLMNLSDGDKVLGTASFETNNISEFINKVSTDPYVQFVELDGIGHIYSISTDNAQAAANAPKAPGFESILSIGLLASMVYVMKRGKSNQN